MWDRIKDIFAIWRKHSVTMGLFWKLKRWHPQCVSRTRFVFHIQWPYLAFDKAKCNRMLYSLLKCLSTLCTKIGTNPGYFLFQSHHFLITKLLKEGCGHFLFQIFFSDSVLNYSSLFQNLPAAALTEDKQINLRRHSGRWNQKTCMGSGKWKFICKEIMRLFYSLK